MGTPHADRLYKMESWRTSALEDSHRHLASVSQSLTQIATGNREVAADLGLECATARAACASLDRLAGRMLTQADALKQIVKSSTDVLNAGIDARNESVEIQAKLSKLNKTIDRAEKFANAMPAPEAAVATERLRAQRQAAHAKIDSLAKTSLSKLNERTLAAIDGLPLHDQASVDHVGRSSAGGQAGRNLAAGSKAGLPTRSAAAWGASVDTSLGGPGRHAGHHDSLGVGASGGSGSASGPGGGGASLQASHYAPPSSGAIASSGSSGSPTGVVGHSPAVHNPLASAVAITGGAGVAGYKAYQAARAARAVQTPAARASVVRAAGAAPSASSSLSTRGIIRGATTAVRTPTGSAGRPAGAVRGGATGIARPASTASGRSAGIVRGATTAVRTPAASGRSASIVRGATTAVRTQTTSPASAGQSGGRAPARGSGARVLTGGRTPTANGTGSSQRADSSRGAGASRGAGSSSRGGLAARSASSVERTPTGQTGRGGATRTAAPSRGQNSSGRLSQSGPRQTEAGNAPRSGPRQARSGSSSRALSSLTGRPDKKNARRRDGEAPPSVSPYEDDKTVTFLEAGHREENNDAQPR
ncbi:hypothetical protein A4H34_00740 [Peptidiphaga gingivicola]|uniref:Uncharacterized protein n=1 Tax=Peptidiphaga gingivicola TaxID=2741497 RepID=A0A179B2Q3_9ACTO|nr:hypothetical protein [Peptidiphaga gingivicola]OAP85760.1 hypothetical protein A4H34_00740 [Peptidiphaga gingivicola]